MWLRAMEWGAGEDAVPRFVHADAAPSSSSRPLSSADWPPHIVAINLLHRVDRWHNLLAEMLRVRYPLDRVHRFEAFKTHDGSQGCTASHLGAVDYIHQQGWQYGVVVEDDMRWLYDADQVAADLNALGHFIMPQKTSDLALRHAANVRVIDAVALGECKVAARHASVWAVRV
jgi:hypothetical protein